MNLKPLFFLATALFQFNAVFSQSNPVIKYLPDDASMIMTFNPIKFASHIPGETFRQSFMYREMMKKDDGELKAFMSDPSISGIDFSHDLILAVTNDTSKGFSLPTINLFGVLKNEAVFSLATKKISKEEDSLHEYGTNKILFFKKGGNTIAWNNEIFVITMGSNKNLNNELYQDYNDTLPEQDYEKLILQMIEKAGKMQREQCFYLLTPRPANAIAGNNKFTTLINTPGDIRIWNSGVPNPLMGKLYPMAALFTKMQQFSGNEKTTVINFENGKIATHGRNFFTGSIAETYKKYPQTGMNTALTRRLPKGKVIAMMNMSFNQDMTNEMMQKSGLLDMVDSIKKELPFDLSLMMGVFKSDMMLAVVKSDEAASMDSITKSMDGIQVILAIPILDKSKFEKLKISILPIWDSLKSTESKMTKGFNPIIKNNNDLLVFSLSQESANAFLNNPGSGTVPEWVQTYSKHQMVMNLNMKELFSIMLSKISKGPGKDSDKKIFDMFDQMIIYGGDFENESLNTSMEFKFSNPDENALKQLFDLMNTAAEADEKKKMERREQNVDSVIVEDVKIETYPSPPPPPPPPPPAQEQKRNIKAVPLKKTKN
jgi:hypothetical protein